jgi:hypothetical protein
VALREKIISPNVIKKTGLPGLAVEVFLGEFR